MKSYKTLFQFVKKTIDIKQTRAERTHRKKTYLLKLTYYLKNVGNTIIQLVADLG